MGVALVNLTHLAPKAAVLFEIERNDGHRAVQGHSSHRICYQSKARMDFLLVNNTNIMSYLAPFLRYREALVRLSLLAGGASIQLSQR